MTFLAPLFLTLAALAGVPLLVHLMRRRVTRRVEFPAVRFLLQAEREHDRERIVRHRLLLLLRLVAVLALVGAVARPIARIGGAGHPPVALAIVLDQSMSTRAVVDGRTVFSRLQEVAGDLTRALAPDDRGWLVSSEGLVATGDGEALATTIASLEPAHGAGDLEGALRRARALVEAGRPRTPVVVVVSDGQPTALPPAPRPLRLDDVAVVVHVLRVEPPANRAVREATPEPLRWVPAGAVRVRVAAADSAPWRVLLGERTLARGTSPAGDGTSPFEVTGQATDTGWLAGRVEVDADDFAGDDVRHFAVRAAPPVAVIARPSAGPFVAAAVEALVDEGRLRRSVGTERARVTLTVASEEAAAPAVRLAPDDPLQVAAANRALERAGIPWRFGAALRDPVTVRPAGVDSTTSGVGAIAGASVALRYRLGRVPGGGADSGRVLAEAGGTPWLVAGPGYVLVASPLAPSATDAPLRAGFVPWLRDLVSQRLGDDGLVLASGPGDTLAPPIEVDALLAPDGTARTVSGVALVAPSAPGVYRLQRLARTVGVLVVNPEESESNVEAWDERAWRQAWLEGTVQVERDAGRVTRVAFDRAGGRSILWPLVLLAIVALALEALVSRGVLAPRAEPA